MISSNLFRKLTALLVLIALTGCNAILQNFVTPTPSPLMVASPTLDQTTPTPTMISNVGNFVLPDIPNWYSLKLTEVRTGDMIQVKDWNGRTLLLVLMDLKCPACLKSQLLVKQLLANPMSGNQALALGIDMNPAENPDELKAFLVKNGFDWPYVIITQDMLNEFSFLYGDNVLTPPSLLLIDRHNLSYPLAGVNTLEDLQKQLASYINPTPQP
jgi:hypothetical protein